MVYLAVAMIAAGLVLPSALRPPPDPANTSNALNPNAPPNQNNPDQILESLQEAGGAGAGASTSSTTTTLRPAHQLASVAPPITLPPTASLDYCYGNPPRQIPSVYAGPCVGAWQGNNGGSTSKNVLPNEIRIGFDNLDSPDNGRLPPMSSDTASTDSQTVTWQVLQAYFNEHYQFYNRKVVFYGAGDPSASTADDEATQATLEYSTYHLFILGHDDQGVCVDFVQQGLVGMCNGFADNVYEDNRPGMFSGIDMDLDQMAGFGAEYGCKTLYGKVAKFGGPDVNGHQRKFGFINLEDVDGGIPSSAFGADVSSECGGTVETASMTSGDDLDAATEAVARFKADGVTTIFFMLPIADILFLMEAATSAAYTPEWAVLGEYSIDNNTIATVLPKEQTAHLFGITNQEWPQVPAATECDQAFHSIDPGGSPNGTTCGLFWVDLVLIMDGIQGAGPDLTPATFQQALFRLGHRFGQAPWSIGGGYGPGSYSYPAAVSEVWYDSTAIDPGTGAPGAYRWTHGGARYQRGQLTGDDSQLFKSGSPGAPEA